MVALSATLELEAADALAQVDAIESALSAAADGFGVSLSQAIDSVTGTPVEIEGDASAVEAAIEEATASPAVVDVEASTDSIAGEIDDAVASSSPDPVDIDVNTDQAQAQVEALAESTSGLGDSLSTIGGDAGNGSGALDDFAGSALGAGNAGALASKGGIAALAVGLGASVSAAGEAQSVVAQLDQLLANAGDSAAVSSEHIQSLATDIMEYSGFSDEAVISGASLLTTFENIASDQPTFDRTLTASADLARFLGTDVPSAAKLLGRALNDPEKGVSRLARVFPSLTAAQQDAIKAMAATGDIAGAQAAIFDIVEGKVGGLAETYGDTFPGQVDKAKESIGELAETIGGQMLPFLTEAVTSVNELASSVTDLGNLDVSDIGSGLLHVVSLLNPIGQIGFGLTTVANELGLTGETLTGFADGVTFTADAAEALGVETDRAAESIDELTVSIDEYLSGLFDLPDAQRAANEAIAELASANAEGTWNDQAVAMEEVVRSSADVIETLQDQGATQGELDAAIYSSIASLARERDAGRITGAQFDTLSGQIAAVPHKAETRVDAPGLNVTTTNMRNLRDVINQVPRTIRISAIADTAGAAAALHDLRTTAQRSALSGESTALPVGRTGTSLSVGQITVQVHGGSGDPTQIGVQVGDAVADVLQERWAAIDAQLVS